MNQDRPVLNIVEVFRRAEQAAQRRKPFIVAERELSFGDLVDRTRRLTSFYNDAGLKPGDRVILASHDGLETPVLFLSLLRCGITAVLIDPETKPYRFEHIIAVSQPKGIILDAALRETWKPDNVAFILEIKDSPREQETLFDKLLGKKKSDEAPPDSYPALLRDVQGMDGPAAIDPELDAYILFTSGTTSDPKGVRISHKNLFSHVRTLSRHFGYAPDCRILNILPLPHVDGIVQGPMVAFLNGAALYRPMRFEIKNLGSLLDALYTFRITHFVAVPTMLSLIEKLCRDRTDAFQTGDFRFIISTGAYLDAKLWKSFEDHFQVRIANVYGLTETVTGSLFSGPTDDDHCIGTIGKPADCEVRIVNERGNAVKAGEPGELLIKGDHVMQGYVNAPEATADILRDGWLHTGDMATVDKKGFYRIVGRKKNIIISGGINIQPEEIDEVLKMLSSVVDAVTFGVPDDTWGERVESAATLDPPGVLSEEKLIGFCRMHLEATKVPHRIHILPSMPKGPVGKVIIDQVKQLVREAAAVEAKDRRGDLEAQIISLAASCFKVDGSDLTMETGPGDTTGWDSLAHLELVTALEARFKVRLSPHEIMRIERLSDAWQIITEKLA
jgi:long-chain acyl-CoA synthetase